MKSTHQCLVYEIKLLKHDNADKLSVVKIEDYTCVVNSEQWQGISKAVWIPPDSLVNCYRPEFDFLMKDANKEGKYRIRAKKLRGVFSFGLLVPAPENANIGDDLAHLLEVGHYEPPISNSRGGSLGFGGESESSPEAYKMPHYDLEAGRKYANKIFKQEEDVVIYEKIHGSFSCYLYTNGRMYCRSKNEFKREYPKTDHLTVELLTPKVGEERAKEIVEKINNKKPEKNLWWKVLDNVPEIEKFCKANPDVVLVGEVCNVQGKGFEYGFSTGKVGFIAFDIFKDGSFLDNDDMILLLNKFNIPIAPLLYRGKYNFEKCCQLAEGKTTVLNAKGIREGIVIRPVKERIDDRYGRAVLKFVGVGYLEKDQPEPLENQDE